MDIDIVPHSYIIETCLACGRNYARGLMTSLTKRKCPHCRALQGVGALRQPPVLTGKADPDRLPE